MKKVFALVLLFLSFEGSVRALNYNTYYSDYGYYSEYQDQAIVADDLTEVDVESRYKWYKEVRDGDYVKSGEESYQYVDYSNYKLTSFSDWGNDVVDVSDDKVVETRIRYKSKKIKPINKFLIQQFDVNCGSANINSIKIYYKGNEIDYDLLYLDKKTDIGVSENLFLYIDLKNYYYLSDLTIEIISTEFNNVNSFYVYGLRSTDIDYIDDIYYVYEFSNSDSSILKLSSNDFVVRNPSYEEEVILNNLSDTISYDVVDVINEYRYRDKLYYFYNIRKEYVDGYYKDLSGYLKDYSDYKLYYRFRSRDRIDIADKIIINSYNQKLDDFIDNNTINYEISGDINYYKNGKYYVKYITDFIEVEKEVTVDIVDNMIKEDLTNLMNDYDKLKAEYKKMEGNYNDLYVQYNKKINESELLVKKYETLFNNNYLSKIKDVEEDKNACLLDLDNMKLKNDDNEKKLKLSNQANDYLQQSLLDIKKEYKIEGFNLVPFIIFGILVFFLIIVTIKKKYRKNKF